MRHFRRLAVGLIALLFITTAALADPPSRAVRLKYMNGQVSIQPAGGEEWVAATINRPLTTGDRIWTDKDARAELHLGTSAMRTNGETSLGLANVGDNTVQVDLYQGTLNLRVLQLYDGEVYEVDTPNLAFTILKRGNYRFDVDASGDATLVTVWKGEGEASGEGPGVRLTSGKQAQFSGGKSLANNVYGAPGFDGFDDWCRVRDEREDRAESVRYVPRGVIGYEDLDGYGQWVSAAPYGHLWVPSGVAVGWAPYRYGHWISVEPWGWTWVDDAPWGFAPFHYGRWVHYRGGWAWCPGPVLVRPYYAPALVAWVGGANWGVGLSFGAGGGVGWFPLGYGEPYIPHYHSSRNYFQSVNITNTHITNITYVTNNYYNNTTNITRIKYVNERVNGAVTAVPRHTFENSRPVAKDVVFVPKNGLRHGGVIAAPEVRPTRINSLGMHADHRSPAPPTHAVDRRVVSRMPRPADFNRGRNDHEAARPHEVRSGENRMERNSDRDEHRPGLGVGNNDHRAASAPGNRDHDANEHGPGVGVGNNDHRPASAPGNRDHDASAEDRKDDHRPGVDENSHRPDRSGGAAAAGAKPADSRQHGDESGAGPRGKAGEDARSNGPKEPNHVIPRPPGRDNASRGNEHPNTPGNGPADAGKISGNPQEHRAVPRPPDGASRAQKDESHNAPAAAAPTSAGSSRPWRDNAGKSQISRPADSQHASSPPAQRAEERPVTRVSQHGNVRRDTATPQVAGDNRNQGSRTVENKSPQVQRDSGSNQARASNAGRQESRSAGPSHAARTESRATAKSENGAKDKGDHSKGK